MIKGRILLAGGYTMKKRVVVALGHRALGTTLPEQLEAVKKSAKVIADLIQNGYQVAITHSNAPQVGMIHTALNEFAKQHEDYTAAPMCICSAMSQGYIGYDLQNNIREELLNRGIFRTVSTVLTSVVVDPYDDAIKALLDADQVVIACGGGGIPVLEQDNHLKGASAVIEKDLTAGKMAEETDADMLIILTSVEKVKIHMGRADEKDLGEITVDQAKKYMEEGHFGVYNMLPKFNASVNFVEGREGRSALITSYDKLNEALEGKTGTVIR